MTKVFVSTLENFAPKAGILNLPYSFRDKQHAFSVLDGPIEQELLKDAQKYRLKRALFL